MQTEMIGLKKGKPLVMKVCAVSDQSRALVVGSFENSALIKSNDCLDNIDVLFIVSDMDTHECESVTLALTQKTHEFRGHRIPGTQYQQFPLEARILYQYHSEKYFSQTFEGR